MSGKASSTAIGAFVVGAIVLVMGAAVFFGGSLLGGREQMQQAVVIFTGSVKGLNVGAPVTLRGVKIGEVTDISINFHQQGLDFVIPVTLRVRSKDLGIGEAQVDGSLLQMLVERGLRAQLKTQSLLTGLLYVDLEFLPASQPRYVDFATELPQLPTAPTEIEAILERVSELDLQAFVQNADEALRGLNALLNDPETRSIPANINATLGDMRQLVRNVDQEVAGLGARLDTLAGSTDATVVTLREQIGEAGARLNDSLDALDATLSSIRNTSDELAYTASAESPVVHELTRSAAELARAARALQSLAESLGREPESLIRGRRDRSKQ
jgi:paraquat-inducible protein B